MTETLSEEKAARLGFTVDRKTAISVIGSSSTLARKMKSGEIVEGRHYVRVPGATKPTPLFHTEIYRIAGKAPEEKKRPAAPKETPQDIVVSPGTRRIYDPVLIAHKPYLTLDEARTLTGFPKSRLKELSELIYGRRVIRRERLIDIPAD